MRLRNYVIGLLIFLMGAISGFGISQISARYASKTQVKKVSKADSPAVKKLSRQLKLSNRQKDKLAKIVNNKSKNIQDLKQEFRPKYVAIREELKRDIQDILDEQQKRQFQAITEKAETDSPWITPQEKPQTNEEDSGNFEKT